MGALAGRRCTWSRTGRSGGAHAHAADPGMAAPTFMATWLAPRTRTKRRRRSLRNGRLSGGRGRNRRHYRGPATRMDWLPAAIRYFDPLIQHRVKAPDGWDRGLPDPGPLARGQVVVHRSPPRGRWWPRSELRRRGVGARSTLWPDNPVHIQHPGPLLQGVLSTDAQNNTVRFGVEPQAVQQFAEIGQLVNLGRIPTEIDTLIWTCESGPARDRASPRREQSRQQASQVQARHEMAQLATS